MNAALRKRYTMEDDLMPIVEGRVPLPNTEDVDPFLFLSNLASGGHSMTPKWGWSLRHEGRDAGRKQWTQFFFSPVAMGGQGSFDGSGYAVIYAGQKPVVLRFAICKHEKVEGAGANHSRGWHPGHCGKCGLDLSVDSGD